MMLFGMGLFPIVRVKDRFNFREPHDRTILDDCILAFTPPNTLEHFVNLDGELFQRAGGYSTMIRDPEGGGYTDLSRGLLIPVRDDDYRMVAKEGLSAILQRANMNALEIKRPTLLFPNSAIRPKTLAA